MSASSPHPSPPLGVEERGFAYVDVQAGSRSGRIGFDTIPTYSIASGFAASVSRCGVSSASSS